MVKPLDLEEQEQIDQLKHVWDKYGNAVTWALTVALLGYAGWNGWQYWQNKKAAQAAVQLDALSMATGSDAVKRIWTDVQKDGSGTAAADQAALLMAKSAASSGDLDTARLTLTALMGSTKDEGLAATARLRLAAVEVEADKLEAAWSVLDAKMPAAFEGVKADRQADIKRLQGKTDEAVALYKTAYGQLKADPEYRALVGAKLSALGVNPSTLDTPA